MGAPCVDDDNNNSDSNSVLEGNSVPSTLSLPSTALESIDYHPKGEKLEIAYGEKIIERRTPSFMSRFPLCSNCIRETICLILAPVTDQDGTNPYSVIMGTVTTFAGGVILGLLLPKDPKFESPSYAAISSCMGYTYFFAWSISKYPQIATNIRRKTTYGLSVDLTWVNVIGFVCYFVYTMALYFSPTVHFYYHQRYGENASIPIQSNDVAYIAHALPLSIITLLQIAYYDGMRVFDISPFVLVFMGFIFIIAVGGIVLATWYSDILNWLDYAYILSVCKLVLTIVKYVPQALLNWNRRSTVGWSIWQTLLDVIGGVLSNLQLVLDCVALNDYSGLSGNIPKLLLGQISLFFDAIFCIQHYILYPSHGSNAEHMSLPSKDSDCKKEVYPSNDTAPSVPVRDSLSSEDTDCQKELYPPSNNNNNKTTKASYHVHVPVADEDSDSYGEVEVEPSPEDRPLQP